MYELRCPAYDADKDGVFDCIASGRYGTLVVFEPKAGEKIVLPILRCLNYSTYWVCYDA